MIFQTFFYFPPFSFPALINNHTRVFKPWETNLLTYPVQKAVQQAQAAQQQQLQQILQQNNARKLSYAEAKDYKEEAASALLC